MPHFRTLYDDREYLFAHDLLGRDVTVKIEKVWGAEVTGEGGLKAKKPIVKFVGKDKKLVLAVTNAKTIATLYGNEINNWIGKSVTLYPTVTSLKGQEVDCIRIRNREPVATAPERERQPGEDDE